MTSMRDTLHNLKDSIDEIIFYLDDKFDSFDDDFKEDEPEKFPTDYFIPYVIQPTHSEDDICGLGLVPVKGEGERIRFDGLEGKYIDIINEKILRLSQVPTQKCNDYTGISVLFDDESVLEPKKHYIIDGRYVILFPRHLSIPHNKLIYSVTYNDSIGTVTECLSPIEKGE